MALFFIANCSLCSFLVHISGWVVRECVTQEHLSNLSCFSFLGHCIAVDENSGVNVLVRPSKKWLRDWESPSFWNACEPLNLRGHSNSTFVRRGRGRGLLKTNNPYLTWNFSYLKSEQGGRGGLKVAKFERTYYLNGPLWDLYPQYQKYVFLRVMKN